MRRQTGWSISKSWPVEPPTGLEYDAAYIVRFTDAAGVTHDLVVEFAAPSVLTSVGYAEEIARRFWDRAQLPAHVIVDTESDVRVVGESPGDSVGGAERR